MRPSPFRCARCQIVFAPGFEKTASIYALAFQWRDLNSYLAGMIPGEHIENDINAHPARDLGPICTQCEREWELGITIEVSDSLENCELQSPQIADRDEKDVDLRACGRRKRGPSPRCIRCNKQRKNARVRFAYA